MGILEREILENSVQSWLFALGISLGIFLLFLIIKRIFKNHLKSMIKKSKMDLDDYLIPLLSQTRWFSILAVGLWGGSLALVLPTDIHDWFIRIIKLILALQVGFWGTGLISLYVERGVASKIEEDQGEDATTLDALGLIVKIALWVILVLIILDNLECGNQQSGGQPGHWGHSCCAGPSKYSGRLICLSFNYLRQTICDWRFCSCR